MKKNKIPYVEAFTDRYGQQRHYFRRPGMKRVPLPGVPGSAEFTAAYAAAAAAYETGTPPPEQPTPTTPAPAPAQRQVKENETDPVKAGYVKHSFGALCHEYLRSVDFKQQADTTRREHGYVIKKFATKLRDEKVASLKRERILQWRDQSQDKPGATNKMIRVLKLLMTFAVDRVYRTDNPAARIKMLKTGHYRPWKDEELTIYEETYPIGTRERTGYALALYTGAGRQDVASLTSTNIVGNTIVMKRRKVVELLGEEQTPELVIPIHPKLAEALGTLMTRKVVHIHSKPDMQGAPLVTTKEGKAMNPVYFGHLMAEAIEGAGLPNDVVLHGLRKCATKKLIEAGCSPHEAAAITGHETLAMIQLYAANRDRKKLAKSGMKKWVKDDKK